MRVGNNDVKRARSSSNAPTDLVLEMVPAQGLIGDDQIPAHALPPLTVAPITRPFMHSICCNTEYFPVFQCKLMKKLLDLNDASDGSQKLGTTSCWRSP